MSGEISPSDVQDDYHLRSPPLPLSSAAQPDPTTCIQLSRQACSSCQTLSLPPAVAATNAMSGASSAVNIPFTFLGCSSPAVILAASTTSSTSSSVSVSASSSSLLSKGNPGVLVSCPPRSQRVVCLLRLSRPCRLTRVIVRNAGSVFVGVRFVPISDASPSSLLSLLDECTPPPPPPPPPASKSVVDVPLLSGSSALSLLRQCPVLVPEHQLCAADVWRDSLHSPPPLPAPLSRVHTFPSSGPMRGSFSPQLSDSAVTALCVEMRGAEDEWSRDAKIGLGWLEVFGVPVPVPVQPQ